MQRGVYFCWYARHANRTFLFNAKATMKHALEEVLNEDVDQNIPLLDEEGWILDNTHSDDMVINKTHNLPMGSVEQPVALDANTRTIPDVSGQHAYKNVNDATVELVQEEKTDKGGTMEVDQVAGSDDQ